MQNFVNLTDLQEFTGLLAGIEKMELWIRVINKYQWPLQLLYNVIKLYINKYDGFAGIVHSACFHKHKKYLTGFAGIDAIPTRMRHY